MKRLLIALALVLSICRAPAALPFYDPLADATANNGTTYTVGSLLANQQNNATNIWNIVNSVGGLPAPTITAGSLSYPGLPQSLGNSVSFVPAVALSTNEGVRLNFWQTNQIGPTYYSYILKITSLAGVPTTNANNWFAGFSDGSTAQPNAAVARVGTRILTKATSGGFVLGVGRNNTPTDYVYDTTVHTLNETIFIVASYELTNSVTNINLWIDPPTNTYGLNTVPTPTVSAPHMSNTTGDINTNRVAGFIIMCQNTNAPAGLLDEVRVGTNWSSVTGGDPAILTQPANTFVQSGHTATFTVVASGTAPLTYQWLKSGSTLSDGGNIAGSSSATLTITGVSGPDLTTYSVLVTNGVGNFVQSISASLALQTDPIVSVQPTNTTVNFGDTATFQVTAGGTSPFSYQWHRQNAGDLSDTGNISGSHTNILTLSGVSGADAGVYSVTVSNINGSADSSTATLTVNDPFFSVEPVSVANAPQGGNVTFTTTPLGTGLSTYQWYKNNVMIFSISNVTGQFTPNLTISSVSAADQANYYVTATGSYGTATSSVVNLTVASPVSITTQPVARTVAPGVRVVFTVVAAGSGTLGYQWQLGGTNIPNANSSFYTVSNAQSGVAGNYQVIVTNSFSSITSSVAQLIVNNLTVSQNNLMVIRVGDGAQALTLNGNSIYLDQYQTDGTYVNTVTIPDTGPTAMVDIGLDNQNGVNSGPTTGSCITRSLDGRFVVIAGYNTNLTYPTNLGTSLSSAVPRGIGLIESHGLYTMPVANTSSNFDATFWRAAITDGTNNFLGAGAAPGTYYFGFDAPPVLVQTVMPNMRSMSQYNGDIYCASAQGSQSGILKISGMPKGAATSTLLFAGSTGTYDMAVSPNGNLIYVADQRALSSSGGIQRYDLSGTNWTLSYTLQVGGLGSTHTGPRYLTADFSGANPVIYATCNEGSLDNNRLVSVVDTGSGSTVTTLAFAGPNQTFRGVQFGPVANNNTAPPLLSITNAGTNVVLSWTAPFALQSSTNATGVYTNLPGASSPFTNSTGNDVQRFFRLRQLE